MNNKKKVGVGAVVVIFVILYVFLTADIREPDPENLNRLESNMTDETRATNDEIYDDERQRSIAFEHTNPGVSSEIYYTVGNLKPNSTYQAALHQDTGLGFEGASIAEQEVTVDEFGVARFVWEINQFGEYWTSDQQWGYDVPMESVTVE